MRVSQVADNYAALHASLRWQVPQQFNMAQVCCARWAQQPDADERIQRARGQAPADSLKALDALQRQLNRRRR